MLLRYFKKHFKLNAAELRKYKNMATRAHLIIKDKDGDERFIYHHWDGYPEGVGKEVREFLHLEEVANIFNAQEFCKAIEKWDCSYEFEDTGLHGDEDYIYEIDLDKRTYRCYNVSRKPKTLEFNETF